MQQQRGRTGIAPRTLNHGTRWGSAFGTQPPLCPPPPRGPRENNYCTLWIGGWVGPTAGLDVLKKRKTSQPYQDSSPRTTNTKAVPIPTPLSRLPQQLNVMYLQTPCTSNRNTLNATATLASGLFNDAVIILAQNGTTNEKRIWKECGEKTAMT